MRDFKIYLFIATVLLVIYVVAQVNRPKPVDWHATLDDNDKIPFGTYIMHQQLKDIFLGSKIESFREPLYNVVTDHGITNTSYILVAGYMDLQDEDCAKLLKFVKDGNDVFISATSFGEKFRKKFHTEVSFEMKDSLEFDTKNNVDSKLLNKSLDTSYSYVFDKNISNYYFSQLDTPKATALGRNNYGHCNFVKYSIGKGALYLNANPLMFTNYALLKRQGASYASAALSYLKRTETVLWDEYYTRGRAGDDNSMRVFLRHEPLKWAFRIAFFSLILFVFYEMKRRQRIIPIIEPLKNSSLDFVNVVGQVYYEQHNNQNIAQKKITYFMEYLRSRYYLKTSTLDEEFIERLMLKTGIESTLAHEIVNHIIYINTLQQVTDRDLILLNQLIQQFYTQSS